MLIRMKAKWLLAVLVAAGTAVAAPNTEPRPAPPSTGGRPLVYVIPIRGQIELALLYAFRRGVAEAEERKASAVVLVMDTPGGRLDATREIILTMQRLSVPTYTFVEKDAFSAGAFIALATEHIYMAPGSVIGAATPMLLTPIGGVQQLPEAVEEKMVSAGAALIRAAAEQGGKGLDADEKKFRSELAEAMVRRSIEIRIGDTVISPAGQLLTLTCEEAARTFPGRALPLLSSGTVADLPALLSAVGLADAEIREFKVTRAERLARFVAGLAPLFLIAGALGLYIEFKTPGFGLPGILGILCLAIFFWGHHIAGLAGREDILIFLIGVLLVTVELVFFPGFGFVGVGGLLLMGAGLLLAMVLRLPNSPLLPGWPDLEWPLFQLSAAVLGTAVGAVLLGRVLPKTKLFRRLTLDAATDHPGGYPAAAGLPARLGKTGHAATSLRPSGVALIEGRRMDVLTRGEYLTAGTAVRVVATHGAQVVVEAVPVAGPETP